MFLHQGDLPFALRTVSALAGITRSVVLETATAEGYGGLRRIWSPPGSTAPTRISSPAPPPRSPLSSKPSSVGWQASPSTETLAARHRALVRVEI